MKINSSICEFKTFDAEVLKTLTSEEKKECMCGLVRPDQILSNSKIREFCFDYYFKAIMRFSMTLLGAFVIIIVNVMLKRFLKKMSKFEKFKTVSRQNLSMTRKILLATFFNTALLTMIMHGNIFGFVVSEEISKIIPPLHKEIEVSNNDYPKDFDRQWYTFVGSKIITTMIIQVFSPHLIWVMVTNLKGLLRKNRVKKAMIQKELTDALLGNEFDLVSKYAFALNTIFVCLFFSSGMPILLPIGFFSLTFQYWSSKYLILKHHRRPPRQKPVIHNWSLKVLPWALVLHLAIGIYCYGSPDIFPDGIALKSFDFTKSDYFKDNQQVLTIFDRIVNTSFLFVLLILIVLLTIVGERVKGWIFKLLFCGCCSSDNVIMPEVSYQSSESSSSPLK